MFKPETVWDFSTPWKIKFGEGAVFELSEELQMFGASKVLFVTDEGVRKAGIVDEVVSSLDENLEAEVYDRVEPEPSLSVFEDTLEAFREFKPDAVVALGGGSSIDVAKAVNVIYRHGGEVLDYIAPPTGKGRKIPGRGLPIVAIPTTSGTGSEVSPVSVVSIPDRDIKVGISSRYMRPDIALVDPLLTVSLPPSATASSGMDALSHAIEAYTTRRYDRKTKASAMTRPDYNGGNPLTDLYARKAIELISRSLRRAYNNGEDLEARRDMALASLMAGIAFTNAGLGATHAIGMVVGGRYHTAHGVTMAIILPAVMEFNAPSAPEKFIDIARLMGAHTEGMSVAEAARKSAEAVRELSRDINIPEGLSELGVKEEDIPELAELVIERQQRLLVGNPRRIEKKDVEEIILNCL
ncbi:MAG: alcohol dehydrogenase [Archaeoglobi archaeon]|nr:alcohol dehydrogenase [Archaeoglobi archaeon]